MRTFEWRRARPGILLAFVLIAIAAIGGANWVSLPFDFAL
jgi:hypothetical protein